ncbi:Putative zinc-finger [Marinobacter sp. es.048]|uniref:anti-sigma factor family protein n=1 Tax=Marinobacter sp. es.048 TaxID=1761795 RepID=UPI000B59480B|nr:zf-HC2 domain-containing protein [Marinobacter sp. es.048]SNC76880.1 Putative zinc-finger [Marinobacter sp. es.048]
MSCNEIRVDLPAYINNELSAPARDRVKVHVAACPACGEWFASERALNRALQEQFSVPAPSSDFHSRVLSSARGEANPKSGWSHGALGGAIAAALALGIGLGFLFQPNGVTDSAQPVVASSESAAENSASGITEPVEKTVRLAFRSGEALENVTLTLELPPNVELASWPGHRELSWQVSLNAGENVLSLPLKLLFPGAGELVARLDTGDRQKTFRALIPEYPQRPVEDPES